MLTVNIEVQGKTTADVLDAIDEARRKIAAGNIGGFDSNDDSRYLFDVSGEEEERDE